MTRAIALACLTVCFGSIAQSQLLIGRLVDVSHRPPVPVGNARVTVLSTRQEAITTADGLFQFALPPAMVAGSEVEIDVEAGSLRVYLPRNRILTVPAPSAKPVEVQLLPAGSKLFLEPAAVEALLARASKPVPNSERKDSGNSAEREPRLHRFLRQWAAEYGFGLEDVQREVKSWADQIRANREKASLRQQALAEFQAQHFAGAAALFEESANAEAAILDRIEAERREQESEERLTLRWFLDDMIRAAEALTESLKFEEAAQVLDGAAKRVGRDRYSAWWGEMQERWASALLDVGSHGEATHSIAILRDAITVYQRALQVQTKEFLPQNWAATQNDLGNAYQVLGARLSETEGAESLRAAVTAYQNALQVQTKESHPQVWAATQNNLGNAYASLGERLSGTEGVESLRAAVTAYQNALQVRTKDSLPRDWAVTENNLGSAYLRLGERLGTEGLERLRAAVTAHQNALQVQTKQSLPQDWAATQNNLGNAYLSLGGRLSTIEGEESLRAAVTAYQNVLQVLTKESLPQDWAVSQNNLGAAYLRLGERLDGRQGEDCLRAAVTAYQNALQVRTKESLPQDWAMTQNNLGMAYLRLSESG